MDRVALAVALIVVAMVVAYALQRRRPAPPTQPRAEVPTQLDRDDFGGTERDWLVVVFTSATCESCERAMAKASVLASNDVVYREVSWQTERDLHDRYGITVVPTIVMAGPDGVVGASFVGAPTATDLWAAMAEMRQPGVSPEPDLGRVNVDDD
ncbi:MAG: glutaredoxin family protein [Acidimicrobiales bacterium]